ncbi:hypothetical protein CW731_05605 [Polaribacter sp. ALD11]|uniref:hypothetical protein n=1 Tax=Polaribacter sp. ALD11 TaxID=2058137 RepID=UPI000C316C66|nr:hypothetical protein [Polaribacter sp. ALD11]AUC84800.1 hypothetical protein CW731_05605 [Polaribacter sp. ALD11]
MITLHTPIIQSPLFIFLLTIISGAIGFYIKYLIDRKKSKLLKILLVDLSISRACVKTMNPLGYLPPTISAKLENLSQTDIIIKGIILQNKKQLDIFPAELINKSGSSNIKQYEISSFWHECQMRNLIKDNSGITKQHLRTIQTPGEFFKILHWYFYHSNKITTKWKDFDKKTSGLIIKVLTNIGDYERKIKKKELKNFKKVLLIEFEKQKSK